jgi:hypothetical protein
VIVAANRADAERLKSRSQPHGWDRFRPAEEHGTMALSRTALPNRLRKQLQVADIRPMTDFIGRQAEGLPCALTLPTPHSTSTRGTSAMA